ncbi:hypothetical protein RUND412_010602 [Rhizina undulata]
MVQGPETTCFGPGTTTNPRKRRRDDIYTENGSPTLRDIMSWDVQAGAKSFYVSEAHHHPNIRPLQLPSSKFTSPPQKLKQTSPPRSLHHTHPNVSRTSPKLKRARASSVSSIVSIDDNGSQMHTSPILSNATPPPKSPTDTSQYRQPPERCHVCSRVQSILLPSFGTVTKCRICSEATCFVCTRSCDSCDETVCSQCSEEKGVHTFCTSCVKAWRGDSS